MNSFVQKCTAANGKLPGKRIKSSKTGIGGSGFGPGNGYRSIKTILGGCCRNLVLMSTWMVNHIA